MDDFVTREECMRTHAPITDFKRETNDNFVRVHARLDKLYTLMITALFSVVASIIIQLISATISYRPPAAQRVGYGCVERSTMNTASVQQEVAP